MDEDPEITVLYDETDDDSSEDYYTTDVDIRQDEKQYNHEDHEKNIIPMNTTMLISILHNMINKIIYKNKA